MVAGAGAGVGGDRLVGLNQAEGQRGPRTGVLRVGLRDLRQRFQVRARVIGGDGAGQFLRQANLRVLDTEEITTGTQLFSYWFFLLISYCFGAGAFTARTS